SMRFRLSCVIATRLPMMSERIAISTSGKYQRVQTEGKVAMKMRPTAANAAAFVASERKVVTTLGPLSYTAGVHIWNGAADTLKASPTESRAMPTRSRTLLVAAAVVYAALARGVVPRVAP